jgi:hypothetical protein
MFNLLYFVTLIAAFSDSFILFVPVMTILPASKINAVDLGSVILYIKAGNLPTVSFNFI